MVRYASYTEKRSVILSGSAPFIICERSVRALSDRGGCMGMGSLRTLARGWRPGLPKLPQLPRYPRNVYLVLLFTLGKGFQIYIGQVTINLYAYSLGYSKDFIGLLSAMPALGALLAAIPIGLLADRVGRKPLLLVSGVLNPLALAAV